MSEETPYQQNAVSAEVWSWTKPPVPEVAPTHSLWSRLIRWLIPLGIAALFYFGVWIFNSKLAACLIAAITTLIFLLSFASPAVYDKINSWIFKLAAGIGMAVTWILLVPFYYLVFPLGHLSARLRGKDALRRTYPCPQPSAWVDRPLVENEDYYETQFSKVARGG